MARRVKNRRGSKSTNDSIWSMIVAIYGVYEEGWTLGKLANACDVDPRDVFRLRQEAMDGFALLHRHFPNADWPTAIDFPVEVIERDPKGHYDWVIVFKPYRNPDRKNEIYADWSSREPTFIAEGKERVVRSRKAAPVHDAFRNALACARRTAGIRAVWIDDPEGLFPPEVRQKSKTATSFLRKSARQPRRR